MNTTKLFYGHEPDKRILLKKDKVEVDNWTDDLEYVNDELDYLIDIASSILGHHELYRQLYTLRRENQLKLGALYRYQGTMHKAIECDTTDCDTYYLHTHEKNRNLYIEHIKRYRTVKSKVLSRIVLNAKR